MMTKRFQKLANGTERTESRFILFFANCTLFSTHS